MCIAIPARIVEIIPGPLPQARLEQSGRSLQCCLAYVPEASIGDYVLVQNGFAIEAMDAKSAAESLTAFATLGFSPS
jgi:hydrogenase expression/formation protein HypC